MVQEGSFLPYHPAGFPKNEGMSPSLGHELKPPAYVLLSPKFLSILLPLLDLLCEKHFLLQ